MDSIRTGALISALRRERGLTQKELAALLGVSDKAVSKWERGECFPDITLIPPLAACLGVSPDELLAGERAEGVATAPETEESSPVPRADPQLASLLLSGAQARLRRCALGALAVLAVGLVLHDILTAPTTILSGAALYPYLSSGLGLLCVLGAAALWLLSASRYTDSLRQYGRLTGVPAEDASWTAGSVVFLAVLALVLSLCLELWMLSSATDLEGGSYIVYWGLPGMAIPLVCALVLVNLLLRRRADQRQESMTRGETAAAVLSLALGVLAALGAVQLVLHAAVQGAYPLPEVPWEVLDDLNEQSFTGLMNFYQLYLSQPVPALRPGVSGFLPLLLAAAVASALVNGLWLARRRTRRAAVCALADVVMTVVLALGPALWFQVAPIATAVMGYTEETGGTIFLLFTPAWLDVTLLAALTLRHLAGVLSARPEPEAHCPPAAQTVPPAPPDAVSPEN